MADKGDIGRISSSPLHANILTQALNNAGAEISGTVTVAGVAGRERVVLIRNGAPVATTYSDISTGAFSFTNCAPGSYEVVVTGGGFYRTKVFGPISV